MLNILVFLFICRLPGEDVIQSGDRDEEVCLSSCSFNESTSVEIQQAEEIEQEDSLSVSPHVLPKPVQLLNLSLW